MPRGCASDCGAFSRGSCGAFSSDSRSARREGPALSPLPGKSNSSALRGFVAVLSNLFRWHNYVKSNGFWYHVQEIVRDPTFERLLFKEGHRKRPSHNPLMYQQQTRLRQQKKQQQQQQHQQQQGNTPNTSKTMNNYTVYTGIQPKTKPYTIPKPPTKTTQQSFQEYRVCYMSPFNITKKTLDYDNFSAAKRWCLNLKPIHPKIKGGRSI